MPRFFVSPTDSDIITISDDDANHIVSSLRMKQGEKLILCDGEGTDYHCKISSFESKNKVELTVCEKVKTQTELNIKITLFQALPKLNKMENIIQKSVELGVNTIVPFIPHRCVAKPDVKSSSGKHARYNKIAREAAMQSERGIVPNVEEICKYTDILQRFNDFNNVIFCYENDGIPLQKLINKNDMSIAVVIGNEGGFEESEVEQAKNAGAKVASLGRRILRCETASIFTISSILVLTDSI